MRGWRPDQAGRRHAGEYAMRVRCSLPRYGTEYGRATRSANDRRHACISGSSGSARLGRSNNKRSCNYPLYVNKEEQL